MQLLSSDKLAGMQPMFSGMRTGADWPSRSTEYSQNWDELYKERVYTDTIYIKLTHNMEVMDVFTFLSYVASTILLNGFWLKLSSYLGLLTKSPVIKPGSPSRLKPLDASDLSISHPIFLKAIIIFYSYFLRSSRWLFCTKFIHSSIVSISWFIILSANTAKLILLKMKVMYVKISKLSQHESHKLYQSTIPRIL
jgi:hypothetical protein